MKFLVIFVLAFSFQLFSTSSAAGLDPRDDDVYEGGCKDIKPAANFSTTSMKMLYLPHTGSYFLASASFLRTNAATFLGRLAESQEEIEQMCPQYAFGSLILQQRGYGNQTLMSVADPTELRKGFGVFDFSLVLAHTKQTKTKYQKQVKETIVWSDGAGQGLSIRCVNKEIRDWKLYSVAAPSDEVVSTVMDVIEKYGFSRKLAVDLRKVDCPQLKNFEDFTEQTFVQYWRERGYGNGQ